MKRVICFVCIFFCACENLEDAEQRRVKKTNEVGEYILRRKDEFHFSMPSFEIVPKSPYPWEIDAEGLLKPITKEYFRCRGNPLNPLRNGLPDCDGGQRHSLPLQAAKEYISPMLISMVNHVQKRTHHRVQITSAHRCPIHNTYADDSQKNRSSKHMIGAELDFFVVGLEEEPMKAVEAIFDYFGDTVFERYSGSTDVRTPPWRNDEIFIKVYMGDEGRDFDNNFTHPYVCVQLRKETYSWERANKGYARW